MIGAGLFCLQRLWFSNMAKLHYLHMVAAHNHFVEIAITDEKVESFLRVNRLAINGIGNQVAHLLVKALNDGFILAFYLAKQQSIELHHLAKKLR